VVRVTVEHRNAKLIPDIQGRLGDLTDFHIAVGALGMSGMRDRLYHSYSMADDAYRTGRLMNSLQAERAGHGGPESHFEVTRTGGAVGSNVPYAAQQDVGGPITPVTAKLLAIPVPMQLKKQETNWPRDIDPGRKVLRFVPSKKRTGGVLIDDKGLLGFGAGILYVLADRVVTPAKNFAHWAREEIEFIQNDLWPRFISGRGRHG